ncbi:MAG: phosphoribosylanthranilate isomerase [Melioribacteraceae bacterium]|nr:phosphoribosylanthranilate isomerase [Melioribacteraceae bacterium]MCF8354199.1 phosphoribosylanthranilate isomerase [Melioribacteraceae bacterium]MCF8392845.1 phosphoribosylanthranilate isomerase [Melioribacteraceae bacterium]MCF8418669.1 phosphoribosylanthranilate isomerase [Melioribacteraceae bacterium]
MKVKICGITNLDDALICIDNDCDALGFIFHENSKRFIHYETAVKIIKQLPPLVMKVGVFVNMEMKEVNEISNKSGLNAVQLHGDESPEYITRINLPVIKSFRVNGNFNFDLLDDYKTHLLLDAYDAKEFGGTGNKFDWNLIPGNIKNKIILAGGISESNIEFIFRDIKPAAIDLSSSLESSPGKKDHAKVKSFMKLFNELRRI